MTRPRIRSVKPEMWQDEKVGRVSREARLLFVVLITLADDAGRFRCLPQVMLGHGFPYDPDAVRRLPVWLEELTQVGLVETYRVGSHDYGRLPKWAFHQKINRPTASVLPEPSVNGHGGFSESSRGKNREAA